MVKDTKYIIPNSRIVTCRIVVKNYHSYSHVQFSSVVPDASSVDFKYQKLEFGIIIILNRDNNVGKHDEYSKMNQGRSPTRSRKLLCII